MEANNSGTSELADRVFSYFCANASDLMTSPTHLACYACESADAYCWSAVPRYDLDDFGFVTILWIKHLVEVSEFKYLSLRHMPDLH